MAKEGIIHPSTSPWCAPAVYVPKSSGEVRICVDFVKLNQRTLIQCHDQRALNNDWLGRKYSQSWTCREPTGNSLWVNNQLKRQPFVPDQATVSGNSLSCHMS